MKRWRPRTLVNMPVESYIEIKSRSNTVDVSYRNHIKHVFGVGSAIPSRPFINDKRLQDANWVRFAVDMVTRKVEAILGG
jgi:hypothetical protein